MHNIILIYLISNIWQCYIEIESSSEKRYENHLEIEPLHYFIILKILINSVFMPFFLFKHTRAKNQELKNHKVNNGTLETHELMISKLIVVLVILAKELITINYKVNVIFSP